MTTSLGISEKAASRSGLSQMRIACGAPNTLTSPTPGDARQRVLEVGRQIVRHVHVGALVGLVVDRDDQQEVGVRLGHPDALLLDLLRQARHRLLDLVLDLDLGDVGVGALGEHRRDADRSARARRRGEIEQPVDAGQLLLDDLRDAALDRLGRRARDSWRGC